MNIISNVIDGLTRVLRWIAVVIVVLMLLAVIVGVVCRFLGQPLVGNVEIVEILLVIFIMPSLVYTQSQDAHIKIGLIVDHFPKLVQNIIDIFGYVTTAALCFIISYVFMGAAYENIFKKQTTLLLEFPHYILKFVIAFGFLFWGLEALNRMFKMFLKKSEKEENV